MYELFTTKIAMCANKINIVNFNFKRTLNLYCSMWIYLNRMAKFSYFRNECSECRCAETNRRNRRDLYIKKSCYCLCYCWVDGSSKTI